MMKRGELGNKLMDAEADWMKTHSCSCELWDIPGCVHGKGD